MRPILTPIVFCGSGSNLYPLCDASSSASSSAKALLPLANRPMLAFALQSILSAGLTTCIILAPSLQHAAIIRALSNVQLVAPPMLQAAPSDRRRMKETKSDDRGLVNIVFEDGSAADMIADDTSTSQSIGGMRVSLLPLGPHDGPATHTTSKLNRAESDPNNFRFGRLGTAELLRWIDSLGMLSADPLILPVDLLAPALPLRDLIDSYVQAQARRAERPTACCALYERGAGEGVGRERERDGPPRLISAFADDSTPSSNASRHRLLFLRDSDLAEDLQLRRSLLESAPRARISTRLLDAHTYILNKAQVLPLLEKNPKLISLRDHVLPLIAKVSWQRGLRSKASWSLPASEVRSEEDEQRAQEQEDTLHQSQSITYADADKLQTEAIARSSRFDLKDQASGGSSKEEQMPIHCLAVIVRLDDKAQDSPGPFVARANTVATYLECNRWLLKALNAGAESGQQSLMTIPELDANLRVAPAAGALSGSAASSTATSALPSVIATNAQISPDSLLGHGVKVGERASIKRSVIGHGCEIARGARLAGCILMDNVKVGDNARLENVICCAFSSVGERSILKDCDVAAGVIVPAETNVKHEKLVREPESDEEDIDDQDVARD